MAHNWPTGCNPPPCPAECIPPPCPTMCFPAPCPTMCFPAPCPDVYIPAPCPPMCFPAPWPTECIPPPCPTGCISPPPVPLTIPIQGGMHAGKIIYIAGIPKQNCSRFNVNLTCGPHDSANIALHFDVRFNFGGSCHVVVRTHKQGGSYGPEERCQNYFPFTPGKDFEIMILAEHASYKIAVNNQHFTEFCHRIHPLNSVTYLKVDGDVVLTQVRFD